MPTSRADARPVVRARTSPSRSTGPLDFALTGVLYALLAPLAEAEISVFTISTYDTDWILVPADRADRGRGGLATTRPHRVTASRRAHRRHAQDRRMSVTHPAGLPRRRRRRRAEASGGKDVALVVNDGPRHAAAAVFTTNRCKANPVLWSEQVVKDGTCARSSLNSGGANCYTGAEGFQTTHAVAERVAARARRRRARRRGLLDRPDRPDQRPRRAARRRRRRPSAALADDGGDDAAERDHDHRHGQQAGRRRGQRLVASAGWPRAPACSRPRWPRCSSSSPPTPTSTPPTADRALRAATRVTFDRLDSDGCMSTNDTVTADGDRRQRRHADRARTSPRRSRRACTDLAMQLLADAEGADHDIAITVLHAATEDDAVEVGRSRRAQQPVQGRRLRQGPQLGPRPGLDRHHATRRSTRPTSTSR